MIMEPYRRGVVEVCDEPGSVERIECVDKKNLSHPAHQIHILLWKVIMISFIMFGLNNI